MVADEQEKRLIAGKSLRAVNCVSVAQRRSLLDELNPGRVGAGGRRVGRLVTRPDDHADLFDARQENLFDERRQSSLLNPIAINQGLQRQGALAFSSGGDDCFSYFHAWGRFRLRPEPLNPSRRRQFLLTSTPAWRAGETGDLR